METTIRPYQASDRDAVRNLCCDTGFLGNPIDPVFEDRELFADFLTDRYLREEPDCAFVVEAEGKVKGYILGARSPSGIPWRRLARYGRLILRAIARFPFYKSQASRRFLLWIVVRGRKEVPPAPAESAHFHINLLPEVRTVGGTRALIDTLLKRLVECGEKRVYGQMSTFDNRRTAAMFRRFGFELVSQAEVTKFRAFREEPVYLSTVVRELDGYRGFYIRSQSETESVADAGDVTPPDDG